MADTDDNMEQFLKLADAINNDGIAAIDLLQELANHFDIEIEFP
jgi:hypothetical protein